jgi:predicted nucleic acid-binding protein
VIVVDASVVVDVTIDRRPGDHLSERLINEDELVAPHLIDIEVLHALRRLVRFDHVSFDRAVDARSDFAEFALTRFPHEPFMDRIWELRDDLSAYDAAYLALAEGISIPLVTCDVGLASVAKRTVDVELYRSRPT